MSLALTGDGMETKEHGGLKERNGMIISKTCSLLMNVKSSESLK